ncbi:nucleoside/nucleotide kinase family protein [Yinghuangia seranimata]|uniref:nucleoside/nucleotide kinase family protein n=1 Tax=Yinghuangia seranimata TaxID=408067 RepID=UPI00248BCAFC|nr:nucleoside/nucleotide kinase family protein [Yinghuangia seranimata]MDI2130006.1 nucleoside/nucleotide kinase family protein [Yinghuangia seranimata]
MPALVDDVVAFVPAPGARVVFGLAGPPAAGKSTLARYLVRAVNARLGADVAAYVPLDGFHLSNEQLTRIGLLDRKGAPDTFDAWGYAALLARLVDERARDVYVPDYDRTLHEPVAARHVVTPAARLVVTEGNYLAADTPAWREARAHIDVLWYVDAPDAIREFRLVDRQLAGGRDEVAARDWVTRSDRPNGEWVKPSRAACDRAVGPEDLPADLGEGLPPAGPAGPVDQSSD